MSFFEIIYTLLGLILGALFIVSPFILVVAGRKILITVCKWIANFLDCSDHYDHNGDYIPHR